MSTDEEKPKFIVDEDWKTRVQAEREAAKKQAEEGPNKDEPDEPRQPGSEEIPPASFSLLATSLATQSLMALGFMPGGEGDQPIVRLDIAKHHIDTLAVLEEKTKGNLTEEESALLSDALHQLRMAYLSASNAPASPPPTPPPTSPEIAT